ncbi:hypothetical protein IC582_000935 [Cucumis melo]
MNSHSQRRNNKKEHEFSEMNKKIKKGIIIPWEQKKEVIDKEEIQIQKDLDQLTNWIKMVDAMNDEKLKEYLQDTPQELKIIKITKCNTKRKV